MKWEPTEPEDGVFTWAEADKMIVFARENNMAVRAHAPLGLMQPADWVFRDGDKDASRELLIERMERHTNAFCERYRDDIFCWDVVNEATVDRFVGVGDAVDAAGILRSTGWSRGVGEDYLDIAYTLARKYAPGVQLYYNDYNEYVPEKRERILKLLRGMQERGIPLDGFGMQSHIMDMWNLSLDEYKRSIEAYAALGLRIQVTELDISLYPWQDRSMPPPPITDEMLACQAKLYRDLFEIYRSYSDVIDAVVFWGAADDSSWIDGFIFQGSAAVIRCPSTGPRTEAVYEGDHRGGAVAPGCAAGAYAGARIKAPAEAAELNPEKQKPLDFKGFLL
jgi:endo-1,4-beta-xylanase